jgi:hypothetical protein
MPNSTSTWMVSGLKAVASRTLPWSCRRRAGLTAAGESVAEIPFGFLRAQRAKRAPG